MAFESFYGGPSGASFVIVKRFDGVDIPQPGDGSGVAEYTYAADYYAIDNDGKFIIDNDNLISRTSENYDKYKWQYHISDGSLVNDSETVTFPKKLAEGMVQHFKKGAASSSEVNYGEYVIIDTMLNLYKVNDPDNGKVFRRGLDITTDLAGAEYIGQIIGPKGETPEVEITSYDNILESYDTHHKKEYVYNVDTVPGYKDGVYQDNIKYAYATLRDEAGNITGCTIGFKVPVLVADFEAQHISAYDPKYLVDDGYGTYHDLVERDRDEYQNGQWVHPFYQKWRINIPKGLHGTDAKNMGIVQTQTMPKGFKEDDFPGTTLYLDENFLTPATDDDGRVVILEDSLPIQQYELNFEEEMTGLQKDIPTGKYVDTTPWAKIFYNNVEYYVKKSECYMDMIRYTETNFNSMAPNGDNGTDRKIVIGAVESIERLSLDDKYLTVYYRSGKIKKKEHKLTWVVDLEMNDETKRLAPILNDGTTAEEFGDPLNFIVESVVTVPNAEYPNAPYGHLYVYYGDPEHRKNHVAYAYPGNIVGVTDEWVDLGVVKGDAGGIHVLTTITDPSLLDNDVPPERMVNNKGVINPNAAGWAVVVITRNEQNVKVGEFYFYDYDSNEWTSIGSASGGAMTEPCNAASVGDEGMEEEIDSDVSNLAEKGLWLVTHRAISV